MVGMAHLRLQVPRLGSVGGIAAGRRVEAGKRAAGGRVMQGIATLRSQ